MHNVVACTFVCIQGIYDVIFCMTVH